MQGSGKAGVWRERVRIWGNDFRAVGGKSQTCGSRPPPSRHSGILQALRRGTGTSGHKDERILNVQREGAPEMMANKPDD